MNNISRVITILLVITFVNACASDINNLTIDNDKKLSSEKGYLLIGIDTSRDLYQMYLDGPNRIRLTSKDLAEGSSYILSDLEAGEYSIDKLYIDQYRYYSFDEEDNYKFTILPGKISYVGHLEIISRGYWQPLAFLQFDNRSSESLVFMEEEFPNILKSRKIIYGGPGEDRFFEHVAKLAGDKE